MPVLTACTLEYKHLPYLPFSNLKKSNTYSLYAKEAGWTDPVGNYHKVFFHFDSVEVVEISEEIVKLRIPKWKKSAEEIVDYWIEDYGNTWVCRLNSD
jgi:hypothetical protein